MTKFGRTLQFERQKKGLSQHRLASAAQSTQRHLSFLETGRSQPTRQMVLRLCEALELPPSARGHLFEGAGFTSPYRNRDPNDAAIVDVLTTLEKFVLANWPYPAFAMSENWDILLANQKGAAMFGRTPDQIKTQSVNLFDLILNEQFRSRITNWADIGAAFYARMHAHAAKNPEFETKLHDAISKGIIQPDLSPLASKDEIPALLAMELEMGDGSRHRLTSLTAQFTSAHDQLLSGIEVEFMLPLDEATERAMR